MYANNFKGGFLSLLYKDMGKQPRLSWEVTSEFNCMPCVLGIDGRPLVVCASNSRWQDHLHLLTVHRPGFPALHFGKRAVRATGLLVVGHPCRLRPHYGCLT